MDENQAKTIRRVFQLKEQRSSWTLTRIAESLNEEGFTTQQSSMFRKVQVKRNLERRDFYSGIYRYGDIKRMGYIKPSLPLTELNGDACVPL